MDAQKTTPRSAEPARAPRIPPRWFIRTVWILHRAVYRFTRGRRGLRMASADRAGYLRLTTVGRRTATKRVSILGYLPDGPDMMTLAMNGWGEGEPAWLLNLQAHPDAIVDVPDGSFSIRARIADTDERSRLWARFEGSVWGDIDGFAARRSRETPIVILEPRG